MDTLGIGYSIADQASTILETGTHHPMGLEPTLPQLWDQTSCVDTVDQPGPATQSDPGTNAAALYTTDCCGHDFNQAIAETYDYSVDQVTDGKETTCEVSSPEMAGQTSNSDQVSSVCLSRPTQGWDWSVGTLMWSPSGEYIWNYAGIGEAE